MTKHRNLADSELHTPKGTDSATLNQMLYASSGAAVFSEFFEPCGTGYASTGVWDYSVDGYDSDGFITFEGLGDYAILELECHNIVTSTDDLGFLGMGSDAGYRESSSQNHYIYYNATSDTVVEGPSVTGYICDTDSTGVNFAKTRIYNFNQAAPTLVEVWSSNPGDSQFARALGIEKSNTNFNKLRIVGLANVTGGKVYLKGIKL